MINVKYKEYVVNKEHSELYRRGGVYLIKRIGGIGAIISDLLLKESKKVETLEAIDDILAGNKQKFEMQMNRFAIEVDKEKIVVYDELGDLDEDEDRSGLRGVEYNGEVYPIHFFKQYLTIALEVQRKYDETGKVSEEEKTFEYDETQDVVDFKLKWQKLEW